MPGRKTVPGNYEIQPDRIKIRRPCRTENKFWRAEQIEPPFFCLALCADMNVGVCIMYVCVCVCIILGCVENACVCINLYKYYDSL